MKLTAAQVKAQLCMIGAFVYVMLFGGSRSGKTFLIVRQIVLRALKAPNSRHLIVRFRFNHVKISIIHDTFPKVMRLCFPEIQYSLDKTDWFASLPGGSEIWFGGLDDKERTEKILGNEYATIFVNEASQVSWKSILILVTRLAQVVTEKVEGRPDRQMVRRFFLDENPPLKGHWSYKVFVQKIDPDTKKNLPNPQDYVSFQINPDDNAENLDNAYLESMRNLPARLRKRFYEGQFGDENPNALFPDAFIELWRENNGQIPDMQRIVVSIDPSGSGDVDNADNDEIGITVIGLGTDGNAYLLEDLTLKAGPATWGKVAVTAYMRHSADCVVAEKNFGGEMVRFTLQTAAKALETQCAFKLVNASRGKIQRAEPVAALYEQGKVRHVGTFQKLEDELAGFSTAGFTGDKSPNRADALIWGLTEIFPAIVAKEKKKLPVFQSSGGGTWA